ncbi:large ribosomal subunit protein mL39 [Anabrus simplex]|uniref:large ribosomal subunit protein mL39 n=1 Tax=Anabrus simplex TaxID=316456 RepID=UPI0035A33F26
MRNRLYFGIKNCFFTTKCNLCHFHPSSLIFRSVSSNADLRNRRNSMFTEERRRQRESIGRIEKIEVHYTGVPEDTTLVMNKHISTPFQCAQHISQMLTERSALALVDEVALWDMHRPLDKSCQLKFLHFKDSDPYHVNKAFWRTCSMILGAVVEKSFKDNIPVILHSFPSPNVKSGSFVYDVELGVENWQPTQDELRILSGQMVEFCREELRIERLTVQTDFALELFADNPHKSQQIPDIASNSPSGNEITLYRIGEYIDISRGPMVANTCFVGRCTVTAVHRIETADGVRYRFQGVALPRGFLLNHFAYGILENRAKNLNPGRISSSATQSTVEAVSPA